MRRPICSAASASATDSHPWLLVVCAATTKAGWSRRWVSGSPIEPLSDDIVRELAISATEATPLRPHEIDLVVTRAATAARCSSAS
jgi:hypothetical protein